MFLFLSLHMYLCVWRGSFGLCAVFSLCPLFSVALSLHSTHLFPLFLSLLLYSVIAVVEVVNSSGIQIQANGAVPSITVDKTAGVTIFVQSEAGRGVSIIVSVIVIITTITISKITAMTIAVLCVECLRCVIRCLYSLLHTYYVKHNKAFCYYWIEQQRTRLLFDLLLFYYCFSWFLSPFTSRSLVVLPLICFPFLSPFLFYRLKSSPAVPLKWTLLPLARPLTMIPSNNPFLNNLSLNLLLTANSRQSLWSTSASKNVLKRVEESDKKDSNWQQWNGYDEIAASVIVVVTHVV